VQFVWCKNVIEFYRNYNEKYIQMFNMILEILTFIIVFIGSFLLLESFPTS